MEGSRAADQNPHECRIGQRGENARPPPAEAPGQIEQKFKQRIFVDDGMTEIGIIEGVLAVGSGVPDHPSPLGDLPAEIDLIHHRREAAQHHAGDEQHDEEPVQLPVQAFRKAFIRHRAIKPLLRRAVKLGNGKRSPGSQCVAALIDRRYI